MGLFVGGWAIWMALTVAMNLTGVQIWLSGFIGNGALALATMIPCYIIGGYVGNWIGKKTNYYLQHYP